MTYAEILKRRIKDGTMTRRQAWAWLSRHGVMPCKIWGLLK